MKKQKTKLMEDVILLIISAAFLALTTAATGMQGTYFWLITVLVLLVIFPAVLLKHLKHPQISVQAAFVLWKTKKGLNLLKTLSKCRLWTHFTELGIIFCFGIIGGAYLYSRDGKKKLPFILAGFMLFFIAILFILNPIILNLELLKSNTLPAAFYPTPEFLAITLIGGTSLYLFTGVLIQSFMIIEAIIAGIPTMPGVAPVIPGVEVPGSPLFFPLHALIALIILIVVHEISHGVIAVIEKIKVKSLGILTAGIIPIGAFTEPDEKQLKNTTPLKRTHVYAAGSMANFTTGFVFLIISFIAISSATAPFVQNPTVSPLRMDVIPWTPEYIGNIEVAYVIENSSAYKAGITNTTIIYNPEVVLNKKTPYSTEMLSTNQGEITLQRDEYGMMGFYYNPQSLLKNQDYSAEASFQKYSIETLLIIIELNFIIGTVNFLPVMALDGGYLFQDVTEHFLRKMGVKNPKNKARKLLKTTTVLFIILIAVNILPYFI